MSIRDRILAATLEIVAADGVAAVTNRRIASVAGVALGSVTYHFDTQTDLLRAALLGFVTAETDRLLALTEQYRQESVDLSRATELTQQVARDLSGTSEQIASYEMFVHAARDAELREAAALCFQAYDRLAVTVLEALGLQSAADLAPVVVATITGLQLRRLATGTLPVDVAAAVTAILASAT